MPTQQPNCMFNYGPTRLSPCVCIFFFFFFLFNHVCVSCILEFQFSSYQKLLQKTLYISPSPALLISLGREAQEAASFSRRLRKVCNTNWMPIRTGICMHPMKHSLITCLKRVIPALDLFISFSTSF